MSDSVTYDIIEGLVQRQKDALEKNPVLVSGLIQISEDDLMVTRAKGLNTKALTEVGFIPDDEYGCKIYGRNFDGRMMLIGIHSRSYGCPVRHQSVGVEIKPTLLRR